MSSAACTAALALAKRWLRTRKVAWHVADEIASKVVVQLWKNSLRTPELVTSQSARNGFVIERAKLELRSHRRRDHRLEKREEVLDVESRDHEFGGMNPEEELAYREFAEALRDFFSRIPAARRDVFLLAQEEDFSYRTIAALFDITVAAAESRVQTVKREMRAWVERYERGEAEPKGHASPECGMSMRWRTMREIDAARARSERLPQPPLPSHRRRTGSIAEDRSRAAAPATGDA